MKLDFIGACTRSNTSLWQDVNGHVFYFISGYYLCSFNLYNRQVKCIFECSAHINSIFVIDDTILLALVDGSLIFYHLFNEKLKEENDEMEIEKTREIKEKQSFHYTISKFEFEIKHILATKINDTTFILMGTANNHIECLEMDSNLKNSTVKSSFRYHFNNQKITCMSVYKDKLVIGLTDSRLHLFTIKREQQGERKENQTLSLNFSLKLVSILAGHGNWIQSTCWYDQNDDADNKEASCSTILLASGSLDGTIRIWKFDTSNASTFPLLNSSKSLEELVPNEKIFTDHWNIKWTVKCDSIIYGHHDSVNCVYWTREKLLLSSSVDHSIIIWEMKNNNNKNQVDNDDSEWISKFRVSDSGEGSFYQCILSKNGNFLISINKNGSIQFWKYNLDKWIAESPISGHFDDVEGCSWSPNDEYLFTTGKDQTTRCWMNISDRWLEIARPQIHGHDLFAIQCTSESSFVSIAEEKIIRVFDAPSLFKTKLDLLNNKSLPNSPSNQAQVIQVPGLGLSNKSIRKTENSDRPSTISTEASMTDPPTESDLCTSTLWPETDKLYGHGNNISTICSSKDFIASAAHSNNQLDSFILIWSRKADARIQNSKAKDSSQITDLKENNENENSLNDHQHHDTWKSIHNHKLNWHQSTILKMQFNPSQSLLLSVGRDRSWSLSHTLQGTLFLRKEEAHSRMIFSCSWITDTMFLTGSRDNTLKLWNIQGNLLQTISSLSSPPTAIDFNPIKNIIAIGFANGTIEFYSKNIDSISPLSIPIIFSSPSSITDLKWSPFTGTKLAITRSDGSIRIITLN